ncbi:MAG: excinuclease ABC subunit UvrC [Methylococcales bacterium]|nr:excinuclease ABC subunit UvrC [Methylococcales bacterium]MCK5926510.1 excinuclease ABC subunit UvrC [Methylococcales bacterium]
MSANALNFDPHLFLQNLTPLSGIYKFFNPKGDIIYIGKAKNLKKRVSSYFSQSVASAKQQVMVKKIARIEVTITHTEGEALLLESQQIKQYHPRYNICLRDDKSYPYIFLSTHHDFPRLSIHRGSKRLKGQYFGPYPSANAVKETLKLLQKIFPVRQCEDSYYNHRSRPCLQYQIKRCSAPCANVISAENYQKDVRNTTLFLEGQSTLLINQLIAQMESSAKKLDYEQATFFRDKISQLRTILEKNFVHGVRGDVDVIACATKAGIACVEVFFIRQGQNLGNKIFFPKINQQSSEELILQAFIPQYYLEKNIPYELIVSHSLPEKSLLSAALSQKAQHNVAISPHVRGDRLKWLQMASANAHNALTTKLAEKQSIYARFINLQQQLNLQALPKRLECFDISHTQGQQTVASCVVFTQEGALKSAYRRFNMDDITNGDDCAAIYQAVLRRYQRIKKGEYQAPDLLFIDGGKGQVRAADKALSELMIKNVMIVGVSKGVDRKAGMEKLITATHPHPLKITSGASALLLIQQIRDEAHRFAITAHRHRRGKLKKTSPLENIKGLGPKRRQQLLKQFGGSQGISRAGVDSLCSIKGINRPLAQRIYDTFHHQDGL